VAGIMSADEHMCAMLSRSADGDLFAPSLRLRGLIAVRGSSRRDGHDKGGAEALASIVDLVRGGTPAIIAVDGPRGPRGTVHRGVASLAYDSGAVILPVVVVPERRLVLRRTWDRFQLPAPFSTIHVWLGPALDASADLLETRVRVRQAMTALELERDPTEAAFASASASPG
jgi:lysophospholipid acyltransferase (LPLAT)-like uncharacterized protein